MTFISVNLCCETQDDDNCIRNRTRTHRVRVVRLRPQRWVIGQPARSTPSELAPRIGGFRIASQETEIDRDPTSVSFHPFHAIEVAKLEWQPFGGKRELAKRTLRNTLTLASFRPSSTAFFIYAGS